MSLKMEAANLNDLKKRVELHEGKVNKCYADSLGKLTFGKIGVDDPLDSATRKELTTRSKIGDTKAQDYLDKAKTSDIMGVKYTVPIDSTKIGKRIRNLFKKK